MELRSEVLAAKDLQLHELEPLAAYSIVYRDPVIANFVASELEAMYRTKFRKMRSANQQIGLLRATAYSVAAKYLTDPS